MTARSWEGPSAQQRQRILRETKTVAIVGASKSASRASYFVNRYLSSTSHYEIFLVNPTVSEIEGVTVYPTLSDLPKAPDLVDVFRKYDDLPVVLEETLEAKATTIWLQLGLWHEQVARDAEDAGLNVVMDRCLKIEHARFHGGLHLAGFDTGVIDSRRVRAG